MWQGGLVLDGLEQPFASLILCQFAKIAAMAATLPRVWKQLCVLVGICFLFYVSFLFSRTHLVNNLVFKYSQPPGPHSHRPSNKIFNSLHLDEATCEATFPNLAKDIGDMVALGPFTLKQARNLGPFQVRIQDDEVVKPAKC